MIRNLWHSRNLLFNLVRRDLSVRYKQTVLGFFWSFAKPLALMLIYFVVFGQILDLDIRRESIPYWLHVLAGVLPWTFFVGSTSEAMTAILNNANLVKKVRLPLEVFPAAAVVSHGVHFVLAMAVLLVALPFFGFIPGPAWLLLPALFALQLLLMYGLALILSSVNVYFRDLASIWEVGSAAWFYATPVIYPVYYALEYFADRGNDWLAWLYLANPMTPIVLGYRRILLYGPDADAAALAANSPALELSDGQLFASLGIAILLAATLAWAGQRIFLRLSRRFADEL